MSSCIRGTFNWLVSFSRQDSQYQRSELLGTTDSQSSSGEGLFYTRGLLH